MLLAFHCLLLVLIHVRVKKHRYIAVRTNIEARPVVRWVDQVYSIFLIDKIPRLFLELGHIDSGGGHAPLFGQARRDSILIRWRLAVLVRRRAASPPPTTSLPLPLLSSKLRYNLLVILIQGKSPAHSDFEIYFEFEN